MAKLVVHPEADLASRPNAVVPTQAELGVLELFAALKRKPDIDKFPNSICLRQIEKGEVVCRQGDAGASAFYILTDADVAALERHRAGDDSEAIAESEGEAAQAKDPAPRATAYLQFDAASKQARRGGGPLKRLTNRVLGGSQTAEHSTPKYIPIDAPTDVNYDTRTAPILPGEIFGEMSCMTFAPRSATVIAEEECFMLEFLRNIFDNIQRDDGYRRRTEQLYCDRALKSQFTRTKLFFDASEEDLEFVRKAARLEIFEPGDVVCGEGDQSDCVYFIRSGLVQIVKGADVVVTASDIADWQPLCEALLQGEAEVKKAELKQTEEKAAEKSEDKPTKSASLPLDMLKKKAALLSPKAKAWQALPVDAQEAARAIMESSEGEIVAECKARLSTALNELVGDADFVKSKETEKLRTAHEALAPARAFGKPEKSWTGFETRVAGKLLLRAMIPKAMTSKSPHTTAPRIITYLSRGDIVGEIGVVNGSPRSASVIAYDHSPDAANRKPSRVEMVRIDKEVFHELLDRSPVLRERVRALSTTRAEETDALVEGQPWEGSVVGSSEYRDLGFAQGQKLLLIDLDRCTRCGDCVRACINTHDDGHTRLFLDGPRFDQFLIPSACRNCRNPACMIGCPVGSIQRGDDGEILIRQWCIGCGVCASQCPYDSIQMHDVGIISERSFGWQYMLANRVSGDAWRKPGNAPRDWLMTMAPIQCDVEFISNLQNCGVNSADEAESDEPLQVYFRYAFHPFDLLSGADDTLLLQLVSKGQGVEVWLNGQTVELQQDARQKKRGEFTARLAGNRLATGENVFAVAVTMPVEESDTVASLRLDRAAATQELPDAAREVEVKLVTEKAVVCDLCSSLQNPEPACVAQCPHDAAIRIDGLGEFPSLLGRGLN
jgi:CRP-like cAMP-binding protein/Fe-S-cluster-containing hydrogenase component 2